MWQASLPGVARADKIYYMHTIGEKGTEWEEEILVNSSLNDT